MMHEAGYIYNDLKLDNILVGECKDVPNYKYTQHRIRIIDFGLCKTYLDEKGEHLPKKRERYFRGNMIFASKNAYNLYTQSRRDDLISLCYLLIFLIDGDLKFLKNENDEEAKEVDEGDDEEKVKFKEDDFLRFRKAKNSLKPKDLCDSEESLKIVDFITEIYKYRF